MNGDRFFYKLILMSSLWEKNAANCLLCFPILNFERGGVEEGERKEVRSGRGDEEDERREERKRSEEKRRTKKN